MRSRLRRVVILGPPLVLVLVAGSALRNTPRAVARSLAVAAPVIACSATDPHRVTARGSDDGTWWTQEPDIDITGTLVGWTLTIGRPTERQMAMALPAASIVSGPDRGRVVATVDDGNRSAVQVIDSAGRCARTYPVDGLVARRAILVPDGSAVIVHLLDRTARRDQGVWRMPLDGSPRTRLLDAPEPDVLARAGISRVWETDLRLSNDASRLAVQSCDPDACVTRVLDLGTGAVATLGEPQGRLVGVTGSRVITRSACAALPCDILAWNLATGRSRVIQRSAVGATISRDGRVVVIQRGRDGATTAAVIDIRSNRRISLGRIERGAFPLDGSGTTGLEVQPDAVGLVRAMGPPSVLTITRPPALHGGNRP